MINDLARPPVFVTKTDVFWGGNLKVAVFSVILHEAEESVDVSYR